MKKYIVCGLSVKGSGVARLMQALLPLARRNGYQVVMPVPRSSESMRKALSQRRLMRFCKLLLMRLFRPSAWLFQMRCWWIRNSIVIVLHPQTTGYRTLLRLMRHNRVFLYVMDNSFFCIRSYNFHPVRHAECLDCLGGQTKIHEQCTPFPVRYNRETNLRYLKDLKSRADKVHFLAQNRMQQALIERHFGRIGGCTLVGMRPGDLKAPSELSATVSRYDCVYHGAVELAKGIEFFLQVAELVPSKSFMVPAARWECEKAIGRTVKSTNVVFEPCTWETGLALAVQQAGIVFNPSLWSAPIEGALLKSLYYAAIVVVVETEYGFENEINHLPGVIRVPGKAELAADIIIEKCHGDFREDRRQLLDDLLVVKNVFDEVDRTCGVGVEAGPVDSRSMS